jgi:glutamyl-tRNA synthetase
MHVGGLRTALFAWLVAKQAGGQFLLRIEDTDRSRHIEEAENHILETLHWLELQWDGEIYRQSEHLEVYKEWGRKLIDKGRAYADPRPEEQIQQLRDEAKKADKPFKYRDYRPPQPQPWDGKHPLRFKSEPRDYKWLDDVMGELSAPAEVIDDFILIKSDGFPTYDFAHIVDDQMMGISHVLRSQEFASSIPKYLNLYEALAIERPKLALLPYVLAPDGKKKLSKRDGAKDALQYKAEGFLPESMLNFLATLGWNDGTEQEIFSRQELISKFSLDRVQRSGAHFDERRLIWMNGHYIRQKPLEELHKLSESYWPDSAKAFPAEYKKRVLALVQERLKYLAEIADLTRFFFEDLPANMELIDTNKQLGKFSRQQMREMLSKTREKLEKSDFSQADLSEKLNQLLEETGQKPAVLFSLIRVATTWAPASPGLAETMHLLGKDKCLHKIDKTLALLEK